MNAVLRNSTWATELLAELAASFAMGNPSHLKQCLPVDGYSDLGIWQMCFHKRAK